MRVLVTGGRHYADRVFLFKILDKIHARRPITLIIEGGASGADSLAKSWAKLHRVESSTYPADWDRYDNHAGRVRNCQMLRESRPDLVVAFQGNKGTRHMVDIAEAAHVKTIKTWTLTSRRTSPPASP